MAFLSQDQVDALVIERMIFHVVGGGNEPVLLREVGVSAIGPFFVDRIASGNTGIMFDFEQRSRTAAALSRIRVYQNRFNRESRRLARLFHGEHSGTMTGGLFMLFQLSCLNETLFAMLKYDQQEVVRFAIRQDAQGRNRGTLRALENALVKTPEALQKSAIVRLDANGGGEVCARDRSTVGSVTRYFQRFLGARRRYSYAALTEELHKATKAVARECYAALAPSVRRNVSERIDDALRTGGAFDPAHPAGFLGSVFGPLPADSPIPKAFERELRRQKIDGETFTLDADEIPRPRRRRMTTIEGITVSFDQQYEDRVVVAPTRGGGQTITINTGGLSEDDVAE